MSESTHPLNDYPFPLRPNLTAMLSLPKDLTREEVKRIVAWLETLATPPVDAKWALDFVADLDARNR